MTENAPIVVQKFGGSSVADVDRIQGVAERVAQSRAAGNRVVVVVSAMGDTTDELLALARSVCESPSRRELDMLLTAGERITMALLSMALNARGIAAVSFTGSQSGIITNEAHTNARIIEVRPQRVFEEIERGKVVIVAGYQGVSRTREVTTLGRGGSDATAVALAAALGAKACEIYSDVDGVYSADPRVVGGSFRLDELCYDEMQALADSGARVLNAQAVEFARANGVILHARKTFGSAAETRIVPDAPRERRVVGVAGEGGLLGLRATGEARELAAELAERGLPAQELFVDGEGAISFLVSKERVVDWEAALEALARRGAVVEEGLGTVSLVGTGLDENANLLRQFLEMLGDLRPKRVTTSRFRISAWIPESEGDRLVAALHRRFLEEGRG